jgi:nucleoside-diphosphate-sugar epimerase
MSWKPRPAPAFVRSSTPAPEAPCTASPRSLPVKEAARLGPPFPTSPYGISKKVVEDYLRFYRSVRGLDFTMLALANVYSPRQDPQGEAGVVAMLASRMFAGNRPVISETAAKPVISSTSPMWWTRSRERAVWAWVRH